MIVPAAEALMTNGSLNRYSGVAAGTAAVDVAKVGLLREYAQLALMAFAAKLNARHPSVDPLATSLLLRDREAPWAVPPSP